MGNFFSSIQIFLLKHISLPLAKRFSVQQRKNFAIGYLVFVFGLIAFILLYQRYELGAPWADYTGFEGKTWWDVLSLLGVPVILALGVWYLNRKDQINEQKISLDRMRENSLQNYIDKIEELLLEKNLRNAEKNEEVRSVARARTLSTLKNLDAKRKRALIIFIVEADLLQRRNAIIYMGGADLSEIDLSSLPLNAIVLKAAKLERSDLSHTSFEDALLEYATLDYADMEDTKLDGAVLSFSKMHRTKLKHAKGFRVKMKAVTAEFADMEFCEFDGSDFEGATFYESNLKYIKLNNSNLEFAEFMGSDLSDANLNNVMGKGVQFTKQASLVGASIKQSNLYGARFAGADLSRVDFTGTDLRKAVFAEVKFDGKILRKRQKKETYDARLNHIIFLNSSDRTQMMIKSKEFNFEWKISCNDLEYVGVNRLTMADLSGCVLDDANLEGALITKHQLSKAASLKHTILPDGSMHE